MTNFILLSLFSCQSEILELESSVVVGSDFFTEEVERGGNVILLFMDDIGIDKIDAYHRHPNPAYTPTINRIADEGLLFTNAYSNPTCSPSRTSILTGRHAYRTGIGRWLYAPEAEFDLQDYERTLPEFLLQSPYDYTSVVTGKWHLASFLRENPGLHPLEQGFEHHWGSMSNPLEAVDAGNLPRGYYNWEKNIDGELLWVNTYMTTDTINDAIYFSQNLNEPFFLYVPLNAPHSPLHAPPENLLREPISNDASDLEKYEAMIEAMDFEIGRLLDSIPSEVLDHTTVFLVGDNGTPMHGIREPFNPLRRKGTVFDGGVQIPFIVWGNLVKKNGTYSDELIHLVDIFSTILDIAGVNPKNDSFNEGPFVGEYLNIDGRSLLPIFQDQYTDWRDSLYTEGFYPNGDRVEREYHRKMIRNKNWKYIRIEKEGTYEESLHQYKSDQFDEGPNLLLENTSNEGLENYRNLREMMSEFSF